MKSLQATNTHTYKTNDPLFLPTNHNVYYMCFNGLLVPQTQLTNVTQPIEN